MSIKRNLNSSNYSDIVEKFLYLEEKFSMFDIKIDNFQVWGYLRSSVFVAATEVNIDLSNKTLSKKLINIVPFFKIFFLFLVSFLFSFKVKKVDLLLLPFYRKVFDERRNNFICKYTYFIDDIDQFSSFSLKSLSDYDFNDIIKSSTCRYVYKKLIFNKIFNLKKINITKDENYIYLINKVNLILDNFNICEKDKYLIYIEKQLNDFLLFNKKKYNLYEDILKELQPKVIIEVSKTRKECCLFNYVAKKMGIKSIELQHGLFGKQEIAYNFLYKHDINIFPDIFFTFGEYWTNNCRLGIYDCNKISIGFNYLNDYKIKEKKINDNRKIILFISEDITGKNLSKLACDLYKNIDLNKYKIIYKLHPNEFYIWKQEYPELVDLKIEVVDSVYSDLYYYFYISTYQVGVYSTALYEGIKFGLKTYLLYDKDYSVFSFPLNEFSNAKFINNYQELIFNIDENKNLINSELFWANDSINKFNQEINKII
ncbi:hypothetical protein [Aliarcobacter cryaerophilus]|uniref:hypothetical protein n=1 Tax=Aliarcobacter cryaerophilus TaxID=28198 RepID=UPI003DA48F95